MRKYNIFSKSLLSTITLFYCIRMSSALMPLIVIPYTARILNHHNFSLFMYALALGIWISMLIGYGDKLSGIRNIVFQQGQLDKIICVISETLTAQSYLIVLSMITLFLICRLRIANHEETLLWLAWGYGVVQGLNPLWIFQGMEKLKPLAYLEFFSNIFILLAVFVVLRACPYYMVAMIIIIFGRLLVNVVAYRFLFLYKVRVYRALWHKSFFRLKEGFGLFFLIASVSVYTTLSSTILGFFSGLAVVGMFVAVEKLTRGFTAVILPISQAVIPHRYALRHQPDYADTLNRYTVWIAVSIAILVAATLYVFAHEWINLFLGSEYNKASTILKILSWVIPCYVFSTILSSQYLIPANKDRVCNVIYFSGGVVCLILAILVVPKYGAAGMSYAVLCTELFVLFLMIISIKVFLKKTEKNPASLK